MLGLPGGALKVASLSRMPRLTQLGQAVSSEEG